MEIAEYVYSFSRSRCTFTVACGREFTLIATKPYIGPSREALEQAELQQQTQVESLKRQTKNVKQEQRELLARIRRDKIAHIVEYLNPRFPKCLVCTLGVMCPGFQRDPVNPALCRHCLHERKQHDGQHNANDSKVSLSYLSQVTQKLEIEVDCSSVPNIDKEEELIEVLELNEDKGDVE